MAAYWDDNCHDVKKGLNGSDEPLVGEKRSCRESPATMVSTTAAASDPACADVPIPTPLPMAKKNKVHHSASSSSCFKSQVAADAVKPAVQQGDRPCLPSPTDVHEGSLMMASWDSHSKVDASQMMLPRQCAQIKALTPTLRGITDAARILNASKLSIGAGKENRTGGKHTLAKNNENNATATIPQLLLSFPTESVYMLACCVKTASSRSIHKLLSRTDSQSSLSSMSSYRGSADSSQLKHAIHPPNTSLEWLLECNDHSIAPTPNLFVCDKEHALNFCHFTKPKTFVIRPPSLNDANGKAPSTIDTSKATQIKMDLKSNSFSPLPVFGGTAQTPVSPQKMKASPTNAISPSGTGNDHKLCAANFSESREAFLRLASKFWPGPVVFHVQARMLGGEGVPASCLSKKVSYSSIATLPSFPSMGDLVAAGSLNPATNSAIVPVLPPSALIPASQLLASQDSERYFVGMQCPSHPLPRKILDEIYRGSACTNGKQSTVSHLPSRDSFASISSDDSTNNEDKQKASSCKNTRPRTSIAVVGCIAPGPTAQHVNISAKVTSANSTQPFTPVTVGATTASDVMKAMAAKVHSTPQTNQCENNLGRVYVVDGEDNRESFSVPTCQYGKPHPVSLVIDGDNKTIHLVHLYHGPDSKESNGATTKENLLTKDSVYRALLKPTSSRAHPHDDFKQKTGESISIDRVITAVLSRWKIQESVIGSHDSVADTI